MKSIAIASKTQCYHCGNDIVDERIELDDKLFCCNGCESVYSILSGSGLNNYYSYNDHPGANKAKGSTRFEYLDEPSIAKDLINYSDDGTTIITLYIPQIHCSSCIWLLEQLNRIQPAIYYSRVDFLRKQLILRFDNQAITLRQVAELLDDIGYEPLISLQDVIKKQIVGKKDDLIRKIAVAGFCFGNVMLLSFPEYLGISGYEQSFKLFFGWLNVAFTIPAVLYSGRDYFVSAWHNLRNKVLNIDFPLALGILVLFIRTFTEVITHSGAGFADTLCGLVFFLLIGKLVQRKTYYHLSFERDYRSFFPVAVQVIEGATERPVPLADLKVGNRIRVRNNEIIPADAILLKGEANIDLSFVTGESLPVKKVLGEIVYAGGRQKGASLELEVVKPVSQSYLTQLWNNEAFVRTRDDRMQTFSQRISKYFTIILLAVAFGALLWWAPNNWQRAMSAFTAVLIIACPCALALSTPFTMSAALSVFDRNLLYLKNTDVVEQMASIDTIVFDKTGTVTIAGKNAVTPSTSLLDEEKQIIHSVCANSTHPLSRLISGVCSGFAALEVQDFHETPGSGISGNVNGVKVRIGSERFVTNGRAGLTANDSTAIHVSFNDHYTGHFIVKHNYRDGFTDLEKLNDNYDLYLVSGDNDYERTSLTEVFKDGSAMLFQRSPQDKLDIIKALQSKGHRVMMIGDGLNDAGALKQSDAGVAITDDVNNFSPGSDAILDGRSLNKLPRFLAFSKDAVKVIHGSFFISLTYNIIGLSYAVTGMLSPLIAAILMPLSTVTIISFTSIATHLAAKSRKLI